MPFVTYAKPGLEKYYLLSGYTCMKYMISLILQAFHIIMWYF